jgi:hypothetical protein
VTSDDEYLRKVLEAQRLGEDSEELKLLRARRDEIEKCIRAIFGSSPVIRYGGSKAKGTLVRDDYDLDLVCYFPRDDEDAGDTLQEIHDKVFEALSKEYIVEKKTSALRIKGTDNVDFHVDVVPGRFIDENSYDVFLYRHDDDKCRLKTNIKTHIEHVRDSGVTDAIGLLKIWRTRHAVPLKTFALELLIIDELGGSTAKIDEQLRQVLVKLRDDPAGFTVKDPANPNGNDLSEVWNEQVRATASAIAKGTLETIDESGWEGVFGKLPSGALATKSSALKSAAKSASASTRPWLRK